MNPKILSVIIIFFTINTLSFSQNYYKLIVCFAKYSKEFTWFFPAFTMQSVGVSRIYFEFTICCANSLWIRFVFRESTMDLLSIYEFAINLLSFAWINYECTLCFAKILSQTSPQINYENTMNSLSVSRFHYDFTIYIADSL